MEGSVQMFYLLHYVMLLLYLYNFMCISSVPFWECNPASRRYQYATFCVEHPIVLTVQNS